MPSARYPTGFVGVPLHWVEAASSQNSSTWRPNLEFEVRFPAIGFPIGSKPARGQAALSLVELPIPAGLISAQWLGRFVLVNSSSSRAQTVDGYMSDEQRFWKLRPADLWGDYGSALVGGLTTSPWQDESGRLLLRRTGPYVPEAAYSDSGFVVVTDDCRKLMLRDFPILRFRPVVKHHIVELHWENWPRDNDMPEQLPDDHEPESYVLHGEHSEECARAMPDLWELDLDEGIKSKTGGTVYVPTLTVDPSTWTGAHFLITIPNVIPIYLVTDTGKQWLLEHASDGFSFRETILGPVEPRS